ncbi:glycosyltransferase family 2 protein [Schaalia canis]|uniref:Glycosyltransferase family 2 protein n=1 Tax=Schaalia canis TaxID=100469 RepID=A0A3P1SCJ6_9ACTO|nr:glycosyltransferase family 2 protein [Schaalia canis]RRC95003.1 glycosyltransferase family 2 protein [Schaalia canis]
MTFEQTQNQYAEVKLPRVLVLMATFNGAQWLREQIDSILNQVGVEVRIIISDDGSTDGTVRIIDDYCQRDARVHSLPRREGEAGVASNFLHLFLHCEPQDGEFIAFSDQDDVWHRDKLCRQIALLNNKKADAVSSNVVSFDSNGHRSVILKSQPQRPWDYVFEAGGPGSTYIFAPALSAQLRSLVASLGYEGVGVHDWYLYALARARGAHWIIDEVPTVEYRQHADNVIGANRGWGAFRERLRDLRSGHYRGQFLIMARAAYAAGRPVHDSEWDKNMRALIHDLESTSLRSRWSLAMRWRDLRRRPSQALQLVVLALLGVW